MKQKTKPYSLFAGLLKYVVILTTAIIFLESCECEKQWVCTNPAVCGDAVSKARPVTSDAANWRESERCEFKIFSMLYTMRFGHSIPADYTGTRDSFAVINNGDSIFQSRSPKVIEGSASGEYFATTVTLGSVLSFKSSNEEYGGGYGDHNPGIGFNVGLGTVLPFSQHWAIAPSVRFTQKKASETIGYSEPGSSMEYKDTYTYNYAGAALLAQYRAGKHLSFVAGPEVNYLVSSSVKFGGSSGTGEKESLTKSSNKMGVDLMAGIKYDIPSATGRSKWGLQLMYDHRLSRLNKKKDENGFEMPAYNMKSVQFGVSYNFCNCGSKTKK